MVTFVSILVLLALVCALASATPRLAVPLWVAVALLALAELVRLVPIG